MGNFDIEQLDKLLNEKKWDEARDVFQAWLKQGLTDEQKGSLYILMANLYMRTSTKLDQEYLKMLDEALAQLKDIDKQESSHTHKGKLDEARKALNGDG